MDGAPSPKELRSTESASSLSPEAQISDNRFHGMRQPRFVLNEEKPWHRIAMYLFATGATSIKEVAKCCEVSEPTVRNLLRQDWFQERVTKKLADNGGRDIMSLLKAEQLNTLVVMVELRDKHDTPAAVKASVCKDIFDRTLGKPVQRIQTEESPNSDDPVAEAQRLEQELARTQKIGD